MFNKLFCTLQRIKYNLFSNSLKLTKVHNTKSKDKTKYYIIRRKSGKSGFFSNFFYVLAHMVYADKKGYTPVVDMENYKTLYNEEKAVNGTKNAWKYYFKQPVSLEKAYKGKNVILSDSFYISKYVPQYTTNEVHGLDKKNISYLKSVFDKYSGVNDDILKKAQKEFDSKFNGKTVVGVHIRGTDMRNFPGHPAPPSVEEYIKVLHELANKNHIDCIMLCTDETDIVNRLRQEFGDMVYVNDSFRADGQTEIGIHTNNNGVKRELHKYKLGLEVLNDVLFLSKCDYLVHSRSNVPFAAKIFNDNKYKECIFIS